MSEDDVNENTPKHGVASRIIKGQITRTKNKLNDIMIEEYTREKMPSIRGLQEKLQTLFLEYADCEADAEKVNGIERLLDELDAEVDGWRRGRQGCGVIGGAGGGVSDTKDDDVDKNVSHAFIPSTNLKPISLPIFNNKCDYFYWRKIFNEVVDKSRDSNCLKMLRLIEALEGEPLMLIKCYPVTGDAYQDALQRLDDEYGGERRLIRNTINAVRNARNIEYYNLKNIRAFISILEGAIIGLRDTQIKGELSGGTLLECAKEKIAPDLLEKFLYSCDAKNNSTLIDLKNFLKKHVNVLSELNQSEKKSFHFFVEDREKDSMLNVCPIHVDRVGEEMSHNLENCDLFLKLNTEERLSFVQKRKLCYSCLLPNHDFKVCKNLTKYKCKHCNKSHNTTLHRYPENLNFSIQNVFAPSMLSVVGIMSYGSKAIRVNVLLDSGSNVSFVNNNIVEFLDVPKKASGSKVVHLLEGKSAPQVSSSVDLTLSDLSGNNSCMATLLVSKNVTGDAPVFNWNDHLKSFEGYNIEFPEIIPSHKFHDVLLGTDNPFFLQSYKDILVDREGPLARLTPLGWAGMGKPKPSVSDSSKKFTFLSYHEDERLETLIRRAWDCEEKGSNDKRLTPDEICAESILNAKLEFIEGRYSAPILWKAGCPLLCNNRDVAEKRLRSVEKNLSKEPNVEKAYDNKIQEYVTKDYIQVINDKPFSVGSWYLPHFPVNQNSKLRIVFDGSSRSNNSSLNDQIYSGPKLHLDIFDVLIRFRFKRFALVADIQEMYLQILTAVEDRKFCRFLWKGREFEWKRLAFGRRDAPYIALKVIQHHADKHKLLFPMAHDCIVHSMYVDDIVCSLNSEVDVDNLREELIKLFELCGMKLSKWATCKNHELNSTEIELFDDLVVRKTLGVKWNPKNDTLIYHCEPIASRVWTKREILREVAKVYDPLGLLEPLLIKAKSFFQSLWVQNLSWDDVLPGDQVVRWEEICQDLTSSSSLVIPRHVGFDGDGPLHIHIFGDASIHAYSSVAYITTDLNGELLCSKAKVTPLKAKSIPRLELMAATMSVRLGSHISSLLNVNLRTSVTFWSDSTTVLNWICQPSKLFQAFVANRVAEIQELSLGSQWRFCPTKLNPADISTRGLTISELQESSLWWNGPDFLCRDQSTWPKNLVVEKNEDDVEKRTVALSLHVNVEENYHDNFNPLDWSSHEKLRKRLAFVLRFIENCRSKSRSIPKRPMNELLSQADIILCKKDQMLSFYHERKMLEQGKPVKKQSSILKLNPILDENGLIRTSSRIRQAEWLPHETRYPVILSKNSPLARLILMDVHDYQGHLLGTNAVIYEVSKKYWIVSIRKLVKNIKVNCIKCIKSTGKVKPQVMASLPKFRLSQPFFPFSKVGIDFCGPFNTKFGRGKSRNKRYVCLFSCLQTRAVHIEVTFSLETGAFINALSRFISRRGMPTEIISDNGKTFVKAEKEILDLVKGLDSERIVTSFKHKFTWHFNPPYGSHFGGVYESMIKAFKRALLRVIPAELSDEELITAATASEGLLNCRPLSPPSADVHDCSVLTPNHFLLGRNNDDIFSTPTATNCFSPNKRWHYVQTLVNHVWSRWQHEILHEWSQGTKWHVTEVDFKIGQIVVAIDPQLPRNQWHMGRVTKVHPGDDGHVRVVDVLMNGKEYRRPISKLLPLPVLC